MSTAAPTSTRAPKRRRSGATQVHDAFRIAAQVSEEKAELRRELEFQITLLRALAQKCEERVALLK